MPRLPKPRVPRPRTAKPHSAGPGDAIPLVRFLVSAGMGARRASAALVRDGRVMVNGAPAPSITQPVRPADRVEVNGRRVQPGEGRMAYLLLNKPAGYLSTVRDELGRPTVMDLVPGRLHEPGLVPAGRLDMDSSGLVLLTNDGGLVHRVTHPRFGVEKEYRVTLGRTISAKDRQALVQGVELESGIARAVRVSPLASADGSPACRVVLVEGRKRQVREMMRTLGHRVAKLERVRLGNLRLGELVPGAVRPVAGAELTGLRALMDDGPAPRQRRGRGARRRG